MWPNSPIIFKKNGEMSEILYKVLALYGVVEDLADLRVRPFLKLETPLSDSVF
jgi:hypothetical protein